MNNHQNFKQYYDKIIYEEEKGRETMENILAEK